MTRFFSVSSQHLGEALQTRYGRC